MTEVDVIDDEFLLAVDPPKEVFAEFVHWVSTTEGWAFQENDYEIWKSCYPAHWLFMVQERGSDKYVASISLAKSRLRDGSPLYTVAFFYCLADYRKKGFGKFLFDKILSIYGDHNCGLFGVGTMWQWYEKRYGFTHLQPYFHSVLIIQCKDLNLNLKCLDTVEEGIKVEDVEMEKVFEYDKGICEMERDKVIESWMTAPGVYSKMAVNSSGLCVGYGCVREVSLNRLNISPLYADTPEIAKQILKSIISSFEFSKFKVISTIFPSTNTTVPSLLESFCDGKFTVNDFTRSQFTQKLLDVDVNKIFGIRHCAHGYV